MAEPTKTEIQDFFKKTRGKLENKVMVPPLILQHHPLQHYSMARFTVFNFVGLLRLQRQEPNLD